MSVSYGGDSITFADGSVQSGASTSFKNRVHNGNFDVWQRGTSIAATTGAFTADRWFHNMWPTANGTVSQVATSQTGLPPNCIKMQRTATSTANGAPFVGQAIETSNSSDLAGQQVTFSYYAKCGANFSASGSNMLIAFWTGTGTDQTCQSGTGNGWTGQVHQINYVSQVITTSWVRYSFTVTIPTNATQIGFQIGFAPTGTAGSDDSIYFTGVQLEKGASASSVEYRPYGIELLLCQRYYESLYTSNSTMAGNGSFIALGVAENTSRVQPYYPFKVQKRASPSTTLSAIGTFGMRSAGGVSVVCTSGSFGAPSTTYAQGEFNCGSTPMTAGGCGWLVNHNGSAKIEWSAEI